MSVFHHVARHVIPCDGDVHHAAALQAVMRCRQLGHDARTADYVTISFPWAVDQHWVCINEEWLRLAQAQKIEIVYAVSIREVHDELICAVYPVKKSVSEILRDAVTKETDNIIYRVVSL